MPSAGLLFEGSYGSEMQAAGAADEEGLGKTAEVWGWCEWMRISLVAAALFAAAIVMAARAAQRAHATSTGHGPVFALSSPERWEAARAGASKDGKPAAIGAIHYWSDDHSTTVSIELPSLIFFEGHRLTGPDRVYFDLQPTRMPANVKGRVIQVGVGETFVRKIRVAEREPGVTRVVLETAGACEYSAMIAPDPYRLIVKLHAPE